MNPQMVQSETISPLDTRERILAAAERLFGTEGFDSVSMRQITHEAGANVAAVNYHFGSKRGLLHEIVSRRLEPMNRQRLADLAALRRENAPAPVPVEAILRAFFEPIMAMKREHSGADGRFVHAMGRAFGEVPGFFDEVYEKHFRDVHEEFGQALQEAIPGLSREDLAWRFHFTLSLMLSATTHRKRLRRLFGGVAGADDIEEMFDRLVHFTAGGFRQAGTSEETLAPAS